jgi:hypothetical protein
MLAMPSLQAITFTRNTASIKLNKSSVSNKRMNETISPPTQNSVVTQILLATHRLKHHRLQKSMLFQNNRKC